MGKTTILIVEDEAIVAADLAGKLGRLGYEVAGTAAQGEEGVALACRLRPHLVLMDIWLEGPMDGIAAAEAIRGDYDVPVIFLTAHSDAATLARAKLTEPFGYILKPFEERELATQIEMALFRHQADQQLRQQREWLRVTLTSIGDAMIATDAEARITFLNPVAEALTGWKADEASGQPIQSAFRIVNERTGGPLEDPVARVLREGRAVKLANHAAIVTKDGRTVPIEDSAAPILDAGGRVVGAVLVFHDVTEKRRGAQRTGKLARLYAVLSQVNEAIVRVHDAESLFGEVCRIVAEVGGFPLVWIGRVQGQEVVPVASYGPGAGYVKEIRVEVEGLLGGGPGGTCIRENRAVVNDDFATSPATLPWREPALRYGFRASASFPLRRQGKAVGEITLYACDANAFDAEQVGLLESLSADLSYALDAIEQAQVLQQEQNLVRASEERFQQLTACVQDVLYSVDGATGEFQYVSPAFERLLGYSLADVAAQGGRERFLAEVIQDSRFGKQQEVFRQLKAEGVQVLPERWEAWWRAKDGTLKYFEDHWIPVFVGDRVLATYGVLRDITERKRGEDALQKAKAAAEAANVAKGQFLANMSHELRTPMNAILGMIDVALPRATDPTVQDCLQTARGSADLLLTLLNDLLDSAKIESGKLELEAAPFSLRRMLDQITRVLSVRASEKGLCFYCRTPDETPDAVLGDRMRLQQVLINLAGNAVKFTDRGEIEIVVHVSPLPTNLRAAPGKRLVALTFSVHDTGIGIPPSGLERIFQPFAQADASMTRRFGGTGLGLSICKSLVEMMGGRIWVESEIGRGSTFYFVVVLPLAKEPPADSDIPRPITAAACTPLHILLVEDNPANQKLATYILQDRGHIVAVAGDGQEAIYLTQENHYDAILMDVQMPGMNGLEATAAIRKRDNGGRRVPIIAMTAHAMKGDREQCLAAGMDYYLSKPINARELIGVVETLAAGSPATASGAVSSPGATHQAAESSAASGAGALAAAAVFDPKSALARCCGSQDMMREMIGCFFDDVDNLFPQMRAALETGDLVEIGRLGHRMKGTVIYLGAQPAEEAALGVERFGKSSDGTLAKAEEAVKVLQRECLALKAALRNLYPS